MNTRTEKIYVQLLDGTTVWVPIKAKKIDGLRFKILEGDKYLDTVDFPLHLFEFWPGDIVELKPHTFTDGQSGQVASTLVVQGNWPDRKFSEFKYKATLGQLEINEKTVVKYRQEIERVHIEKLNGQFFYPGILETIEKLETLKTKK